MVPPEFCWTELDLPRLSEEVPVRELDLLGWLTKPGAEPEHGGVFFPDTEHPVWLSEPRFQCLELTRLTNQTSRPEVPSRCPCFENT